MQKIRASKCELKNISKDKDLIKSFLLENHRQGYAYCKVAYGLFYNEELVQLMSFGVPRFNKNYEFELVRDCTKINCQVMGGVSKLWNHFVNEYQPNSCICYSYPHDLESLYTSKYVDYCGYTNMKKAVPEIKYYFEGMWQGKLKRVDKTILERHGVDRLLKVSIGKESGTNEDIMLNLGFEKKSEDGFAPQLDSYFVGGLVYKITDLDTGYFYYGESYSKEKVLNLEFDDLDPLWEEYMKEYRGIHNFDVEILKEDFIDPKSMYEYKTKMVRKYCNKIGRGLYEVDMFSDCKNENPYLHKNDSTVFERKKEIRGKEICQECGSTIDAHMKTCSKYRE